jgi:hypothetical protein
MTSQDIGTLDGTLDLTLLLIASFFKKINDLFKYNGVR